jgi:hypothetical protein
MEFLSVFEFEKGFVLGYNCFATMRMDPRN